MIIDKMPLKNMGKVLNCNERFMTDNHENKRKYLLLWIQFCR